MSAPNPVLATATRSGRVESWHRGAVVVCHGDEPVLVLGDVTAPVFARSATKPFQALPFLERGLAARLGVTAEELAVMCASHDGTASHVAAVRMLLARGGFREEQLGCGAHAPFDGDARNELIQRGEKPGKVHNNCSGKHTGFLHLARECDDELANYLDPACRSQREVQGVMAAMAGLTSPPEVGLDGCGAPTFFLPLVGLARAFARLGNPAGLAPARADACRAILDAAGKAPSFVAGEQRLCTQLLRTWPGRGFAKKGAEAVYAVALAPGVCPDRWPKGLGIAVKIDDGAERGYQPVVVDLLRFLGVFDGGVVPPPLARFHRTTLHNTQQRVVGDVHCTAQWRLS